MEHNTNLQISHPISDYIKALYKQSYPELFPDEQTQGIVKDIIACTGGSEDISGSRGVTQDQVAAFFGDLSALRAWRDSAQTDIPGVFFLKNATDAAATAYIKVRDKISEYFLRCSLNAYDSDFSLALRKKEEEAKKAAKAENKEN